MKHAAVTLRFFFGKLFWWHRNHAIKAFLRNYIGNDMAVLWSKKSRGVCYEVRTAGKSLRLYTNGVFHSQFNAESPASGSIWDLLFLPAFFNNPTKIKNVLVLGVGGGAVIRQLMHFVKPETITGVELDQIHLHIAKRFFKINRKNVHLYHADAVEWLKDYQGPKFDYIIEDLFMDDAGEPKRAVLADSSWCNLLHKHLTQKGQLVMNFISPNELRRSAFFKDNQLKSKFKSVFKLETPSNENAVAAFLQQSSSIKSLRKNLSVPDLNVVQRMYGEKYRVRTVKG